MTATALNLVSNSQFATGGDFSHWAWGASSGPSGSPATVWAATAKPANGSGGAITFTAGTYTATPYAPPSTNAPAGNAGYIGGFKLTRAGNVNYTLPALYKGRTYTLSWYYAGNTAQSSLHWYRSAFIQVPTGPLYGDIDTSHNTVQWTTVDPTVGWVQESITFTPDADVAAGATFTLLGGGSDVAATNGSASLSGATVVAPLLIANVTLTTASVGARNFPQPFPFGGSANTFVQGNDPRIPVADWQGLLHPRLERVDLGISGGLSLGTAGMPAHILGGATIRQVMASVGSFSGSGTVSVDILVGGATILAAGPLAITSASLTAPGAQRWPNAFIPTSAFAELMQLQVSGISGTAAASNLSVTVWYTLP